MRFIILTGFSFILALLGGREIYAVTQSQMSSTIKSSPQIEEREHLEKPGQNIAPSPSKAAPPPRIQPPPLVSKQAVYFHPGILVNRAGTWEGSDHLLNLSSNIGVYAKLLKPEGEALDITEQQIQKEVASIFTNFSISPNILIPEWKPPLPIFQIEILLYPIEKGYVACCEGRLFESVNLERFKLDPNMAFQAITWEKQTLIVGPKKQFSEQLMNSVREIAEDFGDRFRAYETIKKSIS